MNDFRINAVSGSVRQPTEHFWLEREPLGQDGNGRFIYPAFREYELSFDYLTATEFNQLQTHYNSIGNTGSVVVRLPRYADSTYTFFDYTGCILSEPIFQSFFEEHYSGVRLIVGRIRT